MEGKSNGKGWIIAIVVLILFLVMASQVEDNEYEKAGKEFNTWIKKDPHTWSDTEKQYLDDLMEWSDKHRNN